jgi:hypothetical protein
VLALIILAGPALSSGAAGVIALYCMSCSFVSLAQPAVGMAFPEALAGRALSAYNLVIFAGVFGVQWGFGLAVDGFMAIGLSEVRAFQAAMTGFMAICVVSYLHFMWARPDNQAQ